MLPGIDFFSIWYLILTPAVIRKHRKQMQMTSRQNALGGKFTNKKANTLDLPTMVLWEAREAYLDCTNSIICMDRFSFSSCISCGTDVGFVRSDGNQRQDRTHKKMNCKTKVQQQLEIAHKTTTTLSKSQ